MSEERLSGNLVFLKYVFPAIWVLFVASWVVSFVMMMWRAEVGEALALLAPLVLVIAIGVFFYRKLVWELADEVVLRGDTLYVRRRGVEQRIPLSEVVNIEHWRWMNPQRVTVRLRKPGPFGTEVAFMPRFELLFNPFAIHPVADFLIMRVDLARRREMA